MAGLARFTGPRPTSSPCRPSKTPTRKSKPRHSASSAGGIPGALPTLLSYIDSPHHLVRQAARESLSEFGFPRFLAAFDMLEEDVARCTGMLVKRINVNTVTLLRQEMQCTSGKRRLRALAVARVIKVVPQVEETIIELARQDDHLFRAAAARRWPIAIRRLHRRMLEEARYDSSLVVQEAALCEPGKKIDSRANTAQAAPEIADSRPALGGSVMINMTCCWPTLEWSAIWATASMARTRSCIGTTCSCCWPSCWPWPRRPGF